MGPAVLVACPEVSRLLKLHKRIPVREMCNICAVGLLAGMFYFLQYSVLQRAVAFVLAAFVLATFAAMLALADSDAKSGTGYCWNIPVRW